MTPPKSRNPVSSFGPELLAALTRGSTERVVIPFPNLTKATYFQHRIHTLRSSMRREKHAAAEMVTRAKVAKWWGPKAVNAGLLPEEYKDDLKGTLAAVIVIQPQDAEFTDILARAGIVPTREQGDILGNPTTAEPAPVDPVDEVVIGDPYASYKGND